MKIWAASSSLVELLWGSHMGSCCETSQISVIHPVTWKVSSNEQPEREGSSVAADTAATLQCLWHTRATSSVLGEGPWRHFPVDPCKEWEQQVFLSCPLWMRKGVPASLQH